MMCKTLPLRRKAVVSEHGPKIAPLGRISHDDGRKTKEWGENAGLVLLDPDGNEVATHVGA